MVDAEAVSLEGGCACSGVRYRMTALPLFVHCCHCRWCQRETGSAFVLNALIETDCLEVLRGKPERVATPSESGKGQTIVRCPTCRVALWSHYAGNGEAICFLRAGTLDEAERVSPDVHIYTDSKHPWVVLPEGVPAFSAYYRPKELWPAESQARRKRAISWY